MQFFYASHDGHSRRIAQRIADRLAGEGIVAVPRDLAEGHVAVDGEDLVVVVAAVRYGRHLPQAERFLAAFAALASPPSLVFLSVNLTARKSNKKTAADNPYLRKSLHRHGVTPVLARAIAGRLDYPRYTPFDRFMIRLIMTMTKGPTDPTATVEFTDWDEVDGLAAAIAKLVRESAKA
jgi:menaquinone-dependent protoporphyrinogen oxidase